MAEGGFRLPGTSYEELVNVIVAYGMRDEASNPGDVGKLDSVHRSSATRTNGFLVEIGVLRGEREKLVTKRGREISVALESRDAAEIRRIWRQVVSTSEFLQNVVSAVKMREGMLYSSVQAYIAHAAGQPRNKPVMIGASTVVEILKSAGLLKEDAAGRLEIPHDEAPREEPADHPPDEDFLNTPDLSVETEPESPARRTPTGPGPVVNIHLHVRCEADELEEVAPKLKALIEDLREETPEGLGLRVDLDKVDPEQRKSFDEDLLSSPPGRGFDRQER